MLILKEMTILFNYLASKLALPNVDKISKFRINMGESLMSGSIEIWHGEVIQTSYKRLYAQDMNHVLHALHSIAEIVDINS